MSDQVTEFEENYWSESVKQYLDADHVLHIFPVPKGMKFNKDRLNGMDSYEFGLKATRLQKEIEFATTYKGGNIGCACHDLVVVDLDKKNGVDGYVSWGKLLKENPLGNTWVAITPTGGAHIYFKLTREQKSKYRLRAVVGLSGKDSGIDIRTGRSHVMLPESTGRTLDNNYKRYRWSSKYHPSETKMLEAPEWLLEMISDGDELDKEFKQASDKARKKQKPGDFMPHISPTEYPCAKPGDKAIGRDKMIFKAGSRWVTECEGRVMQGDMTQAEAADFVWAKMNEYNKVGTGGKPLCAAQVQKCYRSVMRYARKQWTAQSEEVRATVKATLEEFPGSVVTEVETVLN